MRIIAFVTNAGPIERILVAVGERPRRPRPRTANLE